MKLKKYQQGGGLIFTPFIPEQWAGTSSSQTSRSGSGSSGSEEAKLDPLDKELVSLMKDQNLLPSDIQVIYNRLIGFQRRSQSLSSVGGGSDTYRAVMPGMLQILSLVNTAKANKSEWDKKLEEVKHHEAGSEVAMDSYGNMWVESEEGLQKIRPSSFDPKKHIPVSNSKLLYLRERTPELAFSEAFGDTALDVVGAADVRKEIDEIIKNAGELKNAGLVKKEFAEIAQDLIGEGIFKVTQKYSKADIKGFENWLYSQLGASSRHLVEANAAIGGYKPLEYIRGIIDTRTPSENDISFEASLTKANGMGGAGGSGDSTEGLVADSYVEGLARGSNFEMPRETAFNPTSKIRMHAYIQNTGVIRDMDGKAPVGIGMVDAIFEKTALKELSPQYTVTFGDQIVDQRNLGQLLYDGSALQRIDLPAMEVNGEITVDWETLEAVEKANQQLKDNGVTPGMLKDLLEDNPKLVYNEKTKRVQARNHQWFLTFGAMMGHDFSLGGIDFDSKYLERMSQDKADFWHQKYEEAINYGFVNHGKNDPKRTNVATDKWGWPIKFDFQKTKYYHGNVFIPILNGLAGATEYSPKSSRMYNSQTKAQMDREAAIQEGAETGMFSYNW